FIDGWHGCGKGSSKKIYKQLLSLGNKPSPDKIDETIGNSSWTSVICNECNSGADFVIEVGEEADYDSATARLCKACIEKALIMVGT
ncbi:hypothetical protein DRO91_06105, partial [Candidatus Heimdallarchaeota archaeon]